MKKLELKKMETIEGGWNFVNGCNTYAFAVLVTNGITGPSIDAMIISGLAMDYCLGIA